MPNSDKNLPDAEMMMPSWDPLLSIPITSHVRSTRQISSLFFSFYLNLLVCQDRTNSLLQGVHLNAFMDSLGHELDERIWNLSDN